MELIFKWGQEETSQQVAWGNPVQVSDKYQKKWNGDVLGWGRSYFE